MESACKKITHVIFDLDGLLIDTEVLYSTCTQTILDRYGKKFEFATKTKMMGRSPIGAATILIADTGIPLTPEEFTEELYGTLRQLFPTAQLMPGAARLVKHLHASTIPMAVATGSKHQDYLLKMSRHQDVTACISHAVCSDNQAVKNSKPAPDIFLLAANQFSDPPEYMSHVLVFEDAPNGIQAAKAAGMMAVMVPDKNLDPEETRLADRVLQSLEDLDLAEWGFPPLLS